MGSAPTATAAVPHFPHEASDQPLVAHNDGHPHHWQPLLPLRPRPVATGRLPPAAAPPGGSRGPAVIAVPPVAAAPAAATADVAATTAIAAAAALAEARSFRKKRHQGTGRSPRRCRP